MRSKGESRSSMAAASARRVSNRAEMAASGTVRRRRSGSLTLSSTGAPSSFSQPAWMRLASRPAIEPIRVASASRSIKSSSVQSTISAPALASRSRLAAKALAISGESSSSSLPRGIPMRSPAIGRATGGIGCSPAITASAIAQSATVPASGPSESRLGDSGKAPSSGMRRAVGLKPTMPFNAAGMRTEPPVSEPMAMSQVPSAAETPAPEDDPPGMSRWSVAFPGTG
ncbi:hypothetical protein D9M70_505410 [compost metagenome]